MFKNNLKIPFALNIFLNIFPIIYTNIEQNKNIIAQQCSEQILKLYLNWEETTNEETKQTKKKTLICLLPLSLFI